MRRAEKALRDAGWEEVLYGDLDNGEEFYFLRTGALLIKGRREVLDTEVEVLCAPRPEPEYELDTVARLERLTDGDQFNAVIDHNGEWHSAYCTYTPQEVEVLHVIAYPDGSTPVKSSPQPSVPRIEVIDDTGRAYVNTCAEDVDAALDQIGGDARNLQGWQGLRSRPGDSFGQCAPDMDAINERADARARELLERLWEKLDEKDDTK
jgi:hypothetical protein